VIDMPEDVTLLIVDGVMSWGFSVRAALTSAGSQSYPLPPPTTLVGALAAAYARLNYLPEVVATGGDIYSRVREFVGMIPWATIKFRRYIISYSDLGRLARAHYLRGEYRSFEHVDKWFGVSSFGKVYAPYTPFRIVYVVGGRTGSVDLKELLKASLSIVSIGSKEGLVHVRDARVVKGRVILDKDKVVKTPYYTLRGLVKDFDVSRASIVRMPPYPPPLSYYRIREVSTISKAHVDYIVPYMEGPILRPEPIEIWRLSDDASIIEFSIDGTKEYIVTPKPRPSM